MSKTYVFNVEIEQEEDGRWSAAITALPGCNAWGYTRTETIEALRENALMYLEVLQEDGDPMPWEVEVGAPEETSVMLEITV